MRDGNLQTTLIEEFQMESHINTEHDESGELISGYNVNDVYSKKGSINDNKHVHVFSDNQGSQEQQKPFEKQTTAVSGSKNESEIAAHQRQIRMQQIKDQRRNSRSADNGSILKSPLPLQYQL